MGLNGYGWPWSPSDDADVAQLAEAPCSERGGWGFESPGRYVAFDRSRVVKVYGPYLYETHHRLRRLVILKDDYGNSRTQSYARYLMEEKLGRQLLPSETVDHIDGDCLNDDIGNFQILSLAENIRRSAEPAPMFEFTCPVCKSESCKPLREVRRNQGVLGKAGPFCSKSCAGRWSTEQQYGLR